MKTLSDNQILDEFFAKLIRASQRWLLLDYDGTLAPFRVERGAARPYEEVVGVLGELVGCPETRVVIISGRALADLIPLLDGIRPLPELWGSHGWERRRPDGTVTCAAVAESAARGLAEAWTWARDAGLEDRCERKPASVAFHTRGLDAGARADLERRIEKELFPRVTDGELDWHGFDGGLELRARGIDKGSAVGTLVAESPESTVIVYAGDDRTDEDAFRALGTRGLRILVRDEFRETEADVWLRPPDELTAFLIRWLDIVKGTP
jgi:trehalose-phosphatase